MTDSVHPSEGITSQVSAATEHCYTPSWCKCPDEPKCQLCKQGRCPVEPETSAAPEPIYGKPFHGWSCECDECQGYDERGEPRPGEAPSTSAARPAVPLDVVEWLVETYDAEGVMTWLRVYEKATDEKRQSMIRLTRMDGMGT